MKYIKTYEEVNNKRELLLQSLFDTIYALYKTSDIKFITKSGEDDGEVYYDVFVEREPEVMGKNVFQLDWWVSETIVTYMIFKVYEKKVSDIENFIESVMSKYDIKVIGATILAYGINFDIMPEIIEDLSLENFEIYKAAKKYNL